MSYGSTGEPIESDVQQQRSRAWLERVLLAAFLFCLLIGLAALGIFFVLRNDAQPTINANPLQSVRTELILPQLALRELGGDAAAGLANQALQAGHLETARAVLTYATDIPPVERAARLAHLGRSYLAAGEPERAAQVFALTVSAAVLDDSIPVIERVNLLNQATDGLYKSGQASAAAEAATQSLRIAAQAPALLPAQRSTFFTDLLRVVEPMDDRTESIQALKELVNDYARNPYLIGAGILVTPTLATFAQPIAYDSPTQDAVAVRQQAARILADRIELTGGIDIEPERQALAQALTAEDEARTRFYASPGDISRGQQLWLLLDRRAWLATKARIAMEGYGLSILPEWEAQLNAILGELGAANNFLNTMLTAHAEEQPSPLDKTVLRIETQHWLAAQAERGLYPDAPVTNIGELLRSLQDELQRQGTPLALPVAFDSRAVPPVFRIQQAP